MKELSDNFVFLWSYRIAPYWSEIIPILLCLIAVFWIVAIYLRGKFRFLPALAIARVTVLDSIGRLEVIVLLAIGMLVVGVNGVIPNTLEGRQTLEGWMNNPYFQEKLNELSGADSFTPQEDDVLLPPSEDEFGQLSSGTGEFDLTETGETDEPGPEIDFSRAEEIAARQKESTLQALIWQGAFLIADFFVALIGFVLAMVVLPNELNRGVILSILPKPLSREEYVFGKALGIWVIVAGSFLILAVELFLIQGIFDAIGGRDPWNWRLIMAMALFPFKYATLVLIIMGLTLRLPEVPAGIVGVALFATGHFVDRIYEIATSPELNAVLGYAMRFSYWVLPHLSQVTFGILDRDESMITNWNELWGWVWQISIYNIILLSLLSWLFRRRSL